MAKHSSTAGETELFARTQPMREPPAPGAGPAHAPARGPAHAPAPGPAHAPARGPAHAPAPGPAHAPARGPARAPARTAARTRWPKATPTPAIRDADATAEVDPRAALAAAIAARDGADAFDARDAIGDAIQHALAQMPRADYVDEGATEIDPPAATARTKWLDTIETIPFDPSMRVSEGTPPRAVAPVRVPTVSSRSEAVPPARREPSRIEVDIAGGHLSFSPDPDHAVPLPAPPPRPLYGAPALPPHVPTAIEVPVPPAAPAAAVVPAYAASTQVAQPLVHRYDHGVTPYPVPPWATPSHGAPAVRSSPHAPSARPGSQGAAYTLPRTPSSYGLEIYDDTEDLAPPSPAGAEATSPRAMGATSPRAMGAMSPRAMGATSPRAMGATSPDVDDGGVAAPSLLGEVRGALSRFALPFAGGVVLLVFVAGYVIHDGQGGKRAASPAVAAAHTSKAPTLIANELPMRPAHARRAAIAPTVEPIAAPAVEAIAGPTVEPIAAPTVESIAAPAEPIATPTAEPVAVTAPADERDDAIAASDEIEMAPMEASRPAKRASSSAARRAKRIATLEKQEAERARRARIANAQHAQQAQQAQQSKAERAQRTKPERLAKTERTERAAKGDRDPILEELRKPAKAGGPKPTGPGKLSITSSVPTLIYVDGRSTNLMTPRTLNLPAGTHKITLLDTASRKAKTVDVDIAAGALSKLDKKF